MFIPVRGIASLTRAAVLIVAGAVVSKGFKSTKPFAKSMGENIEKFGKWLQEESEEIAAKSDVKAEPAKAAAPKQGSKPKTAAATKRAPAAKKKPATARKAAPKKPAEPKAQPDA